MRSAKRDILKVVETKNWETFLKSVAKETAKFAAKETAKKYLTGVAEGAKSKLAADIGQAWYQAISKQDLAKYGIKILSVESWITLAYNIVDGKYKNK